MTCANLIRSIAALGAVLVVAACDPEVGSTEWCEALNEKPKGDWTFNETADYTKHCIIRSDG